MAPVAIAIKETVEEFSGIEGLKLTLEQSAKRSERNTALNELRKGEG